MNYSKQHKTASRATVMGVITLASLAMAFSSVFAQGSGVYVLDPTGDYGSTQVGGAGKGNWEGYSINGRYNFMSSDNSTVGIYDDVNNRWRMYWDADDFDLRQQNNELIMHADEDAGTLLYFNGSSKLTTDSEGVSVTGTVEVTGDMRATRFCDATGSNCLAQASDVTNTQQVFTGCSTELTTSSNGYWGWGDSPACPSGYVLTSCGGSQTHTGSEIHGYYPNNGGCRVVVRNPFGNYSNVCIRAVTFCAKID